MGLYTDIKNKQPEVALSLDGDADIEALLAEEAAADVAKLDPRVADAFTAIDAAGAGCPRLTGRAAQARVAHYASNGQRVALAADGSLEGSGKLAGLPPYEDPEKVIVLGADMKKIAAKRAAKAAPAAIVPPEAPASRPELAADPLPDGVAIPPGVTQPPAPPVAPTPVVTAPPAAKPITSADLVAAQEPKKVKTKKVEAPAEGQSRLFVNCVPSTPYESLVPHVDKWCEQLAIYYSCDPPDIRVQEQGKCSHGKWRGVLAAVSRTCAGKLPPADYAIDVGNELHAEVAAALPSAVFDDGPLKGRPVFSMIVKAAR